MANTRTKFTLFALFCITLLSSFDRQIVSVVAEPIRLELRLGDSDVGLLSAAFLLAYALLTVPAGRLSDGWNRSRLLTIGVFVWSLFTAAAGCATGFGVLVACRTAVGAGEATHAPAVLSLIGDSFPSARRSRAMSIVLTGIPVGVLMSFALGGAVAAKHGWRAAFFLAFVPGLLCTAFAASLREPPRTEHAQPGHARALRSVLSSRALWVLIVSGALHFFALLSLASFMAVFLMRYYRLPLERTGMFMGIIAGIAPVAGLIVTGALADRLIRRRKDAPVLVTACALLVAAPAFGCALALPEGHLASFVALAALAHATMFPMIALTQSAIAEVVPPGSRGTAISVHSLLTNVVGGCLGPLTTGFVSDALARRAAVHAGAVLTDSAALEPFRANALHDALYIVPALDLFVGLFLLASLPIVRAQTATEAEGALPVTATRSPSVRPA